MNANDAAGLLAGWGVVARALRCVARSDAPVWRVRTSAGADLALRVAADGPDGDASLHAQADWLDDLGRQGLRVPQPLATLDGRWCRAATVQGRPVLATVVRWVHGRQRWAGLRPVHLRRSGELIARLHLNAIQRAGAGQVGSLRPAYGPDLKLLAAGPKRLHEWGGQKLMAAVAQAASRLRSDMQAWPKDASAWGFIHGDLHPWNLVFADGTAGAIDFDDSGWGFFAQDLAAVLQFIRWPLPGGPAHQASHAEFQDALIEGYATFRAPPPELLLQVDRLHTLRMLGTLHWMLQDWPAMNARPWGPGFVGGLLQSLNPT